jgi:hypothetical protein
MKSSTTFEFVFDDWNNSWEVVDFDAEQSGNSLLVMHLALIYPHPPMALINLCLHGCI